MNKHTVHTLGTAAKATGKAKGTIRNAIVKGRLSASKDEKGQYAIDPAELHRVFKPLNIEQVNLNAVPPPIEHHKNINEHSALEAQIDALKTVVEDLKNERNEWRKQAQTLAITQEHKKKSKGFFGLFKKTG